MKKPHAAGGGRHAHIHRSRSSPLLAQSDISCGPTSAPFRRLPPGSQARSCDFYAVTRGRGRSGRGWPCRCSLAGAIGNCLRTKQPETKHWPLDGDGRTSSGRWWSSSQGLDDEEGDETRREVHEIGGRNLLSIPSGIVAPQRWAPS